MNDNNESRLTYFTKDPNWKIIVTTGSIIMLISVILNVILQPGKETASNLALLFGGGIVSIFLSCIMTGFYMTNTNSLINNETVKLANFSNIPQLIITGLKYLVGLFLYSLIGGLICAVISVPLALITPLGMTVGMCIVIPLMVFALIYAGFSYSEHLTFSSIFSLKNYWKYKIGKFVLFNILYWVVIFAVAFVIFFIIKDAKVAEYGFYIIIAPIMFIYSLLISKIQADSIKETNLSKQTL